MDNGLCVTGSRLFCSAFPALLGGCGTLVNSASYILMPCSNLCVLAVKRRRTFVFIGSLIALHLLLSPVCNTAKFTAWKQSCLFFLFLCLFTVRELRQRNNAWGCFISPQPRLLALCSLFHLVSLISRLFHSILPHLTPFFLLRFSETNLSYLPTPFFSCFIPTPLILLTSCPFFSSFLVSCHSLSFTLSSSLFFMFFSILPILAGG